MRGVIIRFLQLDVQITHPLIPWVMAGIWFLLIATAFSSLRRQSLSVGARWIWFSVIVFVPILGLFLYTVYCLFKADWSFLKPLMQSRSTAVRAVTRTVK